VSNDNPAEKSPLKKKMGLGRGLDALLGEALRGDSMAAKSNSDMGSRGQGVATLSVIDIRPNPDQPRRHFADEKLDELAASIAKHGVIQPIIVRPFQGGYQIVAGERR
jgi:ParB family chromosome partitioning protein